MKKIKFFTRVTIAALLAIAFTDISVAQNFTGPVGIGTSSPSTDTKLHIVNTASGGAKSITIENTSATDPRSLIYFLTGPTSSTNRNLGYIGGEGLTKSLFVRNMAGGNIELLTTTGAGNSGVAIDNSAATDSRANLFFRTGPSTATNRTVGYVGAERVTNSLILRNTNGGGLQLLTGTRGLFVSSTGNVSIGASPSTSTFNLDIVDASPKVRLLAQTNGREIRLDPSGSTIETYNDNLLLNRYSGKSVGIGDVCVPSEFKLGVKGKVLCEEVKVSVSSWCDYVFASNYKLRPLAEVETFITKNKHLPEIPSAAEVEKNGINLGEMDALLLKKIEELTLYMIEIKKENEEMKKKDEVLKAENEALKVEIQSLKNNR